MRTASGLTLRARATGNLALLDEAEQLADDAHAWCAIAESSPVDRAKYALSRALALAGAEVRIYRNVARIQRTRLNDAAAGQQALAAAAAAIEQRPPSTMAWCELAQGWRAAGDHDAAQHYLEHATASATSVEDWCAVGNLERAERAARTTRDWIAVAKACDDAQDLARLTANLPAGVRAIASCDDAIVMIRMLDAYGEDTGAAYGRGIELAKSADDWIALSMVSRSDTEVQQCLNNAGEIGDPNDLARIDHLARGRMYRSGQLEPSQPLLRPHQLLAWSPRTLGWPHEPAALFDELRRRISRASIEAIANGDYGQDYEEHLRALDEYVRTGGIRHPIEWFPLEVLQLERWNEGENIDHLARAFVCTALCLDDAGPTSRNQGTESTIPVLLESAIVLGGEAVDAVIGLFAAMANSYPDGEMRAFVELALVLAAVWRDAGDPRIPPLVARLVYDEARLREKLTRWGSSWLLGLTNFDLRHPLWRNLAREILGPSVGHDPTLTQLATRLAG